MCFSSVNAKKLFAVGLMWATLAVDLLFYGAVVPLMPMYVTELNGNGSQNAVASEANISGDNKAQEELQSMNNLFTGALLSLSQWTQIASNFFVGPLVDAVGSDVPLFIGYFVMVASCVGFSFANAYAALITWRGLQGVGSAFLNTAGVAVIADMFRDDDVERGKMIGVVMCGLSVGTILGPPFGALLYQIGDKSAPFLAIAGMTLAIALLQICVRIPKIRKFTSPGGSPTWKAQLRLIRDPYILMCSLLIVLGYFGCAVLEAALPIYMLTNIGSETWMAGVVFLPQYVGFAVSIPVLAWMCTRVGRWPVAFVSFIIGASALVAYPFSRKFTYLLGLGVPIGVEIAAVDAALYPIMAYLVDTRIGEAIYGSAYALANVATCLAFAVGPLLSGVLMTYAGFHGTMYAAAALTIFALLPAGLLRKPLYSPLVGETAKLVGNKNTNSNSNGVLSMKTGNE